MVDARGCYHKGTDTIRTTEPKDGTCVVGLCGRDTDSIHFE